MLRLKSSFTKINNAQHTLYNMSLAALEQSSLDTNLNQKEVTEKIHMNFCDFLSIYWPINSYGIFPRHKFDMFDL